jgi:phage repressor protein C with HTH and peptisase S24 domain
MQALLSWQRIRITGHSMTPTLLPGDLVLVRHGKPVRPDAIVLARFRAEPELPVIKRAVRPDAGGWLVASDNARAGSDSRQHGAAEVAAVAIRIWHRGAGRPAEPRWRRWLGWPVPAPPPDGL